MLPTTLGPKPVLWQRIYALCRLKCPNFLDNLKLEQPTWQEYKNRVKVLAAQPVPPVPCLREYHQRE
jgi:hypothetical protein